MTVNHLSARKNATRSDPIASDARCDAAKWRRGAANDGHSSGGMEAMSANDIHGLMMALPAPEDGDQAVLYKLAEIVLIDLNRIADAQEEIAKILLRRETTEDVKS